MSRKQRGQYRSTKKRKRSGRLKYKVRGPKPATISDLFLKL